MRLETAKMSFESNPSSKSSPSSTSSTSTSTTSTSSTSCPFDALFSGVVSVHSMLPELHNLKLEVSLTVQLARLSYSTQTPSLYLDSPFPEAKLKRDWKQSRLYQDMYIV